MDQKPDAKPGSGRNLIIFGMYSNFIRAIQHFDSMQTFYRIMASTFMLGSFAALGFLFSSENKNLPYQNILPVLLVCCIGVISMIALWYLDLIFYERLLSSNFAEALKMEREYDWIPKVHTNMLQGSTSKDKPSNIVYYYIGSISSLLLTGGLICVYVLAKHGLLLQLLAMAGTFLVIFGISFYLKKRTKKIRDLLDSLHIYPGEANKP